MGEFLGIRIRDVPRGTNTAQLVVAFDTKQIKGSRAKIYTHAGRILGCVHFENHYDAKRALELDHITIGAQKLKLSKCCRRGGTVPSSQCPETTNIPDTFSTRKYSATDKSLNGTNGNFRAPHNSNGTLSNLVSYDSARNSAVNSQNGSGAFSRAADNGTLSNVSSQKSGGEEDPDFQNSVGEEVAGPEKPAEKEEVNVRKRVEGDDADSQKTVSEVYNTILMDKLPTSKNSKLVTNRKRKNRTCENCNLIKQETADNSSSGGSIHINLHSRYYSDSEVVGMCNRRGNANATAYSSTSNTDKSVHTQVSEECESTNSADGEASDSDINSESSNASSSM